MGVCLNNATTSKTDDFTAQVTFKVTLGEFDNFWQHCKNYNSSI